MRSLLNLLQIILFTSVLISCSSTISYYQVYKAKPTDQVKVSNDQLIYEDANCRVVYNLWSEGGDIGFSFYNKGDQPIYINKEESFFFVNGEAKDYYLNRTYTQSKGASVSRAGGVLRSTSVLGINRRNNLEQHTLKKTAMVNTSSSESVSYSYQESKIVCIPPNTYKRIEEYSITASLYRSCDLLRHPKKVEKQSFTEQESPLKFGNRISYRVGKEGKEQIIENKFYTSEIANYSSEELEETILEERCGEKSMNRLNIYKIDVTADQFYMKYSKSINSFKY